MVFRAIVKRNVLASYAMFQVVSAGLIESEIGVPCMKEKACIAQSIFPNKCECKCFLRTDPVLFTIEDATFVT